MDKNRAKELLPIIQAFVEGKTIQVKIIDNSEWGNIVDLSFAHLEEWGEMCYRIKPEGEITVKTYENHPLDCYHPTLGELAKKSRIFRERKQRDDTGVGDLDDIRVDLDPSDNVSAKSNLSSIMMASSRTMNVHEYHQILAERTALDKFLNQLSDDQVIERVGLVNRKKEIDEIVAEYDKRTK